MEIRRISSWKQKLILKLKETPELESLNQYS
nr:MAG TPA: hypothetical protein [Caudoviricetes sp.]